MTQHTDKNVTEVKMSDSGFYKRTGKNDAVYDDGVIKLNLTIEPFQTKEGQWGYAVYLPNSLSQEDRERAEKNIRESLDKQGFLFSTT